MEYITKEVGSIRSLRNKIVKNLTTRYNESELKRLINFLYVVEEYDMIVPVLDKFNKEIRDKIHFNEVRASVYMIENNLNDAERMLIKNVRLSERSDNSYYRLARFYMDFDASSKLIELVKEIGIQHPKRAITPFVIAMFYTYVGRFDDADIYYEKAIKKAPQYGDLYAIYALSKLYEGDIDKAFGLFAKSVEVTKKSFDGVIFLNRYYITNERYEESISYLESMVELFDDYPFYLQFLVGHSYMMNNNLDMAFKAYKKVYSIMFNNKQEKLAIKLAYNQVAKK